VTNAPIGGNNLAIIRKQQQALAAAAAAAAAVTTTTTTVAPTAPPVRALLVRGRLQLLGIADVSSFTTRTRNALRFALAQALGSPLFDKQLRDKLAAEGRQPPGARAFRVGNVQQYQPQGDGIAIGIDVGFVVRLREATPAAAAAMAPAGGPPSLVPEGVPDLGKHTTFTRKDAEAIAARVRAPAFLHAVRSTFGCVLPHHTCLFCASTSHTLSLRRAAAPCTNRHAHRHLLRAPFPNRPPRRAQATIARLSARTG